MKIFISILLMMFFTYNQVFAIAPLNEQTITAAQKYGIENKIRFIFKALVSV